MRLCLLIFVLIIAFFGICWLDCEVEDDDDETRL